MQTSADVTKRPDALKAQEHGLKVLECGGISVPPSCVGQRPKNGMFWAWFGRLSRLAQITIGDSEIQ